MDLFIILSILLGCFGIYLLFWRKSNIFHHTGIPHIKPWPILGNMDSVIFQKMSLPGLLSIIYNLNSKAKYVGFYEFMTPTIIIRDPDIIKSIGIKHFETFSNRRGFATENQDAIFGAEMFSLKNEKWHQVRSILSPSFTSSKMKIMFKLISQQSKNFCDYNFKENAIEMDIRKSFQKLTADIIAICSYGISTNCVEDPNNDLYLYGLRGVNLEKALRLKLFIRNFPILWKFLPMRFIDHQVVKFFRSIVESTITARKENKIFRPDMLHLMMNANQGESDKKKEMSIELMTAQVFIFFFGSFHTTSGVLTYLTYEMARNTDIQKRLQEEIDSVIKKANEESTDEKSFDNQPTYEKINSLRFLDAVIKETLRMHSVVPILERICSEHFELPPALPGLDSFTLKPGMMVWISSEGIQHDPAHYENPKEFNPDRFLKEDEKIVLNSPTFLPFGLGPRACIGYRFALLIFKVVIFNFFAKCNVKVCSKTPIPLTMCKNTLSNTSESVIWLQVEKRELCK